MDHRCVQLADSEGADVMEKRTISWFSCGAPSAVATKLALQQGPVTIAYCEVKEEHPDNTRFLKQCEEWFGQKVIVLGNEGYDRSIYEVFRKTRYLKGVAGARCTGELKKKVREAFERPTDRQVFGYTVEEQKRVDLFIDANNDVDIWPILIEKGLTKADCKSLIRTAGIELPAMYRMGYHNNNCVGCVKGAAGYCNKIRREFPEAFERMNEMEKHLGRTVCKIEMSTVKTRYPEHYDPSTRYWRPRLDELPPDAGVYSTESAIECGIFCEMVERELAVPALKGLT